MSQYKLARAVTLWSATELAPATTALGSGAHIWWLTNNTFSASSTTPPLLSVHKVILDGLYDRAVLAWAGKIKAVGTQTLCTACPVKAISALLYKNDSGLAFFDDSLISQLQGSAVSPADAANGEAAMIIGGGAGSYSLPVIVASNTMTGDLATGVPVIGVAGGRTPVVGDVTKFNLQIGRRVAGGASVGSNGNFAVDPDISGVAEIHLGLKWIPTWTNGAGPFGTSIAGQLLLLLFRKQER